MIKAIYAFDWLISVCSFVCSSNRWPFSTMCSLSILSSGIKCDAVHIIDWETYVCTIFRSNIVVTISFFFFPSFQWASFFFVFCVSCHQMSTEKEENAKKVAVTVSELVFFPAARVLVHERRFFMIQNKRIMCVCWCRLYGNLKCQMKHLIGHIQLQLLHIDYIKTTHIYQMTPSYSQIYWMVSFLHQFFLLIYYVVFFSLHDSLLTSSTPHAGVYSY